MGTMIDKIEIHLVALDEYETPEESEYNTKSAPGFAESVRNVMEEAGKWGWCTAMVNVRAIGNRKILGEGFSYLGNCCYRSAEDFVNNSGYFPQMVEEALKEAKNEK